ncbi:MAG: serine protease [Planctomycetaceae bacterium]|nr:serine protease [Planctomycetaceae bacterium]
MKIFRAILCFSVSFALFGRAASEEFGVPRRNDAYRQPAAGTAPPPILPYVVRIIAFDANGQSFGTGAYVGISGEYGIVLTNWHVVCETKGLTHIHFPSGFSSFGAVVRSDPKWDLALIAVSKPPQTIPVLPVSQTPSKPGEPLWIAGYGSGSYRIAEGRCVRYLTPENPKDGSTPLYEIVEVSVSARKGDSGGPILNQRGELAGVLFGSDMVSNTAGSFCERVNRFLMETSAYVERLPARPETHFAGIEKGGPFHSLRESRDFRPQPVPVPPVSVPVRHYVQPPASSPPGIPPAARISAQSAAVFAHISDHPVPAHDVSDHHRRHPHPVQPILLADLVSPAVSTASPPAIAQTSHLVPLMPLTADADLPEPVYTVRVFADRRSAPLTMFILCNMLLGIGLSFAAVRLIAAGNR